MLDQGCGLEGSPNWVRRQFLDDTAASKVRGNRVTITNSCISLIKFLASKKTRTDAQMKFYKVVARPTLQYGSETWVTTKRDMTRLEAAEMCFLRSVTGYTWLDKIRSEVIRAKS